MRVRENAGRKRERRMSIDRDLVNENKEKRTERENLNERLQREGERHWEEPERDKKKISKRKRKCSQAVELA